MANKLVVSFWHTRLNIGARAPDWLDKLKNLVRGCSGVTWILNYTNTTTSCACRTRTLRTSFALQNEDWSVRALTMSGIAYFGCTALTVSFVIDCATYIDKGRKAKSAKV